jgi:hypothetical protein
MEASIPATNKPLLTDGSPHFIMKQRPFADQRVSMRTNVLLQRPKVGQVIRTTRTLPADEFAYTPMRHDGYGVKEIFSEWEQTCNPRPSTREASARHRTYSRQDFVATNRAALRGGCISAKEFREFKKKHEILVKPEENYDAEDDEYNKIVRRNTVHGIATPVNTEMAATLTWQYGREAVERARSKQTLRHMPTTVLLKRRAVHGIKPTRASRGETVKPPPPPTVADMFKMKRFLAINRYAIDDTWS